MYVCKYACNYAYVCVMRLLTTLRFEAQSLARFVFPLRSKYTNHTYAEAVNMIIDKGQQYQCYYK